MTQSRTATLHYEFTADDGTIWHDKCRNTLGGWTNLMARIEARLGGRARALPPGDGSRWECGETRFTVTEVQAL